jgi:ABC-2 type transport system permease protein
MKDILLNEWRGLIRKRLFQFISLFFIAALAIVTWLGEVQNQKQIEAQNQAHKHIRAQWEEMKPTNPHGAAHFGSYAFKPNTTLSSIDEGVHAVTGNVLRLEAHIQNDAVHSEASQSLIISKFGKLKPSLLFQFIIPLFLIFLAFNTYTQERDSGRLKLLLVQGLNLQKLLFAKIVSIWLIGILLLLFAVGIQILFHNQALNSDAWLRLLILLSSYSLYYFIVTALTVLLSVLFKSSTASLAFTIAIWAIWTIFLPKIAGNAVEKLAPLPTRVEFQKAMNEDRAKGIDGHNPWGETEKELIAATLAKYQVESISELPINFDGLLMQADEEYGNSVWDKHFGDLYTQMQKQKRTYQLTGLVNPFASVQNLSMGAAGTDMFHHLDFLRQAENYRRTFISLLNEKHAYGGSTTGDWDWKADNEFYRSIADFNYNSPTLSGLGSKYTTDLLILLFWGLSLITLVNFATKRISIL